MRHALLVLAPAAAALALAADAAACVCAPATIEERLDEADVAFVGRVVAEEAGEVGGAPQRLLTVEVDQRVKGDVERTLVVRSPSGTSCDLLTEQDDAVGLLLTRAPDGALVGTTCSLVDPGQLVAVGGEPRGGPIKVAVGLLILAFVLLLALVRLRRRSRPSLPGAPEP